VSPIKAVIFDMYDTLAPNPEARWRQLFVVVCLDQGLKVDPMTLYGEWKSREMGFRKVRLNLEEPEKSPPFKSYETAWRECFADAFEYLKIEGDAARAARAAVGIMGEQDAFPETHQAMGLLQARWKTGILSNADDDYLLPQIKKLGLKFQAVLSSEMVRAYKPHPRTFQEALTRMDVKPQESVYVGDNPFDDVLGAKRAGMGAVWVNRNGRIRDASYPTPDYEIKSLLELPQIIERWKQ
jgi:2-haloacid dehalogenase